jgi:CBS domain-containing protein
MQVREIMTENPACCTPETSLQEVARMMVEHDCGCIPVVENQSSMKPVGTVTDRDITIRAFAATGAKNPLEMKAADVMTVGLATITPETSVQECCNVMEDKKIRRVLVTDETGRLRGIVAQADVAQYGPNPTLVSNVVYEISESAPSPNRAVMRDMQGGGGQVRRSKKSFLSARNVLPILAGVGAGAALTYFFDTEKRHERRATDANRLDINARASEHHSMSGMSADLPNRNRSSEFETRTSETVNDVSAAGGNLGETDFNTPSDETKSESSTYGKGRTAGHH